MAAGSRSSQPCTCGDKTRPLVIGAPSSLAPPRHWRPLTLPSPPPGARGSGARGRGQGEGECSSRITITLLPIRPQDALGLALGVFHGLFRRLGARERGLEPVVERLGHALVVVGGGLRHRVLE